MLPRPWLLAGLLVFAFSARAADNARLTENFDFGWRFFKGDATGADQAAFDDSAWRKLSLPHDWSIEGPLSQTEPAGGAGGFFPTGVGWYRKRFTAPESLRGKKVSLTFDGIYMNSDVYLNGHLLGHWPYGYTTLNYDITPYLNYGATPNVVSVRVDDSAQPASRWYAGAGIYRNVWITATDPVHVAQWGTYVTTPKVAPDAASVWARTEVKNESATAANVTVVSQVLDAKGGVVASGEAPVTIPANGTQYATQTLDVANPALWSPDAPNLYKLHTQIKVGEKIVDDYDTTFGVRSIYYDVNRGLLLNGVPVKMLGMCLHGDAGAVGVAVPDGVLERRLRALKEMGCNAIRMSHNPPSPEMLDLCDQLGFLVMDEAFDEWLVSKVREGYSKYFTDWSQKDLTVMLRRDRNHPSVVMWSVGNEIREQTRPNGPALLKPLVDTCHREDPTRPVTSAMDNIFTDAGPAPTAFTDLLDVVGYNYVDRWGMRRDTYFADDRVAYPNRKMVGTEDNGLGSVRGQYAFRAQPAGTPERASYASAMIRAEQLWEFNEVHDYVVGYFTWTGIDYLGEAGAWPRKGSTSGALDSCAFPKDGYYFYQSQWTQKPMIHLLPHWNWAGYEGEVIPVIAYTNCDVVELFLNGKSFGAKALEYPRQGTQGGWNTYARPQIGPTTADLHLSWDVPYAPGTLRAVGYKNGQVVATEEVHTAGPAAAIVLEADKSSLQADQRDVAHLTVKIVDAQGNLVPDAANEVTLDLQGPAQLLGFDNGDMTDHTDYKSPTRKTLAGLALGILQATNQTGEIRVHATSGNLKDATVTLQAEAMANPTKPTFTALDL
ncbi:MAG TPA: glycoside hydrolase family 2 TIM barrel-domain containing protein [Opitutales bacterium]|nr:glycoside hydrolase family 2 TIM barrel-domain containing protein [Opitutales bacterium]